MKTKICSVCKKEKDLDCFAWKNKKLDKKCAYCKKCFNTYVRKKYYVNLVEERKRHRDQKIINKKEYNEVIVKYLMQHPCVDCGETDVIVLQFDHRDEKSFTIGGNCNNKVSATLIEEIKKCDVRCANCHVRKTAKEQNWRRYQIISALRQNLPDSSIGRASPFGGECSPFESESGNQKYKMEV